MNQSTIEKAAQLIEDRTVVTDGCWEWVGARSNGYARIKINGKWVGAHRIAYQTHFGDIPSGHVVDHICHTRHCLNPDHLRAVEESWNVQNIWKANSSTGHRNVYRKYGKYMVQVNANRKRVYGGQYSSLADAIVAAKRLRKLYFPGNVEPDDFWDSQPGGAK